jgi:hypothetical protein
VPRGKNASKQQEQQQSSNQLPRRIQKDDEWGGFVPLNLSEQDREAFSEWWTDHPVVVRNELDDALGAGLKFTVSYDGGNSCYIASLTGRPDSLGVRPFTCCLSARSGTFDEAVALLMYKHGALLLQDWWELVNQPRGKRSTFG